MLTFTVLRANPISSVTIENTSIYLSWIKPDHTTGKYSAYSAEAVRELMVTVPKFWLKKKKKKSRKKKSNTWQLWNKQKKA